MQIDRMTVEDASYLAELDIKCFAVPWSEKSFREECENPHATYFVAKIDGKIVGYGGVWIVADEAQITNVAIHPDYQGQGISRRLLENLIEVIKARGAERLTLEVRPSNTAALNLYTSLGFKDCGRRPHYYEDGEDAIIMWILKL